MRHARPGVSPAEARRLSPLIRDTSPIETVLSRAAAGIYVARTSPHVRRRYIPLGEGSLVCAAAQWKRPATRTHWNIAPRTVEQSENIASMKRWNAALGSYPRPSWSSELSVRLTLSLRRTGPPKWRHWTEPRARNVHDARGLLYIRFPKS